jgi:L,D-transpeptidase-like protein
VPASRISLIAAQQLAAALERLDPRDGELLALSLRRRVPDEALARMYDIEPADVVRRRAAAIERLADELGIQRGEDLGSVLKALLEPGTWAAVGSEFGGEGGPRLEPPEVAPEPKPLEGNGSKPVLEMLDEPPEDEPPPERGRRFGMTAAIVLGLAAIAAVAGYVGATRFADDDAEPRAGGGDGGDTRHFVPEGGGPLAAPFADQTEDISCYTTAYVQRPTTLYREPGGARRIRISARTEWNSPRVLGVVKQRGDWLGVQSPELRNDEIAWIPRSAGRLDCVRWSLHADLSERTLFIRKDGRTVRKLKVAVGRQGNPTPEGRFSVTDKLRVTDPGSPYGCCVLAVTGHQTNLPPDWPGGDRLAVHATRDESSIGQPASLGCLRTTSDRARWLIETIPLGAPLFVRA